MCYHVIVLLCNCVIMYLFYFMWICLHVCMKLRCLNMALQMWFKMKSIRINRIISLMSNLNTIYNEIHQLNNEFWDSILLICLTDHIIFICKLFYDLIYGELTSDYIVWFWTIYYLCYFVAIFCRHLHEVHSVNCIDVIWSVSSLSFDSCTSL